MMSWWIDIDGTIAEVEVYESLGNRELGSLIIANRSSLDIATTSQMMSVHLWK